MKFKNNLKISLFSLLILLAFNACQKVIDVDLNSKDPLYVVEGFVTLGETTHRLTITKSLDIDESIAYPAVDNATVVLSDDQGNSQVMAMVGPGIYEVSGFSVSEGHTYSVSISVDEKQFNASGKMPFDVPFDSLEVFPFSFGPASVNTLVPIRIDPAGIENFYQFNIIQNGKKVPGIFIQYDKYSDGNEMKEPLFAGDLLTGDTVKVEMFGIDKTIFTYFYTLQQNQQGATPANPTSNFSGGCLGYFSVRTKGVKQIVIP
jgi:hypothetical protein